MSKLKWFWIAWYDIAQADYEYVNLDPVRLNAKNVLYELIQFEEIDQVYQYVHAKARETGRNYVFDYSGGSAWTEHGWPTVTVEG